MTKNGLNAKGIAHAKYSVTFGPKKKLPKTCEKRFYKHIKVVLCKKLLEKKKLIFENRSILKVTKNGHNTKAAAHPKYSVWVKKSNC